MVLSLCAISNDFAGWEAIDDFGKEKEEWLLQYISLENSIPSHDFLNYLYAAALIGGGL